MGQIATLSQSEGRAPNQWATTLALIARRKALHTVQQNQLARVAARDFRLILVSSAKYRNDPASPEATSTISMSQVLIGQ